MNITYKDSKIISIFCFSFQDTRGFCFGIWGSCSYMLTISLGIQHGIYVRMDILMLLNHMQFNLYR